jgi:hypothetical protein
MQLNPEFLRQHYAAMSDEELQEVDRADLVEAARRIFDEEFASRESPGPAPVRPTMAPRQEEVEPDWLEDAAEAYSSYARPGTTDPSEGSVDARDALEAAEIPCHLELHEEPDEGQQFRYRWRVLVPGKMLHRATSVLDRDIFNEEFEHQWKSHLEMLTDEELRVMEPQYAFCGLYDRLERVNRAYDEELERRRMDR